MTPSALPDLDALRATVEQLAPAARVVVACYLVLGAAIAADLLAGADRTPMGPARARSLAATAAGALVASVPLAAALAAAWSVLARLAPGPLAELWGGQPLVAAVACFVVVDAVAYLYHRVGHATRVGWAAHGVHHAGEAFDMALVLRQPWLPVHGLAILPLTSLAGFSLELAAACSAISVAYQGLQHTSSSWGLGRFEAVVMSGRAHRRHHTVEGGAVNLGAVLAVWDRAFGTWCGADVADGARYGWGAPEPPGPVALQLAGWRAAWRPSSAATHPEGASAASSGAPDRAGSIAHPGPAAGDDRRPSQATSSARTSSRLTSFSGSWRAPS